MDSPGMINFFTSLPSRSSPFFPVHLRMPMTQRPVLPVTRFHSIFIRSPSWRAPMALKNAHSMPSQRLCRNSA